MVVKLKKAYFSFINGEMEYSPTFSSWLYYIAFSLFILFSGISYTMFAYENDYNNYVKYVKIFCMMLIAFRFMLTRKWKKNEIVVISFLYVVLAVIMVTLKNVTLPLMITMFFGAAKCDEKKLAKIYFSIIGTLMLVAFSASQLGIIEDRMLNRYRDGVQVVRHSFGYSYVTTFAEVFFFVVAASLYLRKGKNNVILIALIFVLTVLVYRFTDARLEVYTLVLMLIAVAFFDKLSKLEVFRFYLKYSFLLSFIIIYSLIILYILFPYELAPFDAILSERLSLSVRGFKKYGFTLFGQEIPQQGWGTINFDWKKGYFFLDSFYVNYTLKYGVLFFSILTFEISAAIKSVAKRGDWWLLLFVAFASFHGIFTGGLLSPETCPFFCMLYASYTNKKVHITIV